MQISRRERILMFIGLYVIMAMAFIWFFYLPQSEEVETLKNNNQALTIEKQNLAAQHQKLKREQASPVSAEVQNLHLRIPDDQELLPLLKFIDQTTAECKIPFVSVEYQASESTEKAPAEVRIVTFRVGTSGNIYGLIDFLRKVKEAPRLMAIEDIRFNACKAESGGAAPVEVESGPPAYYIPPPDVPEAKLERVRFIIQEVPQQPTQANKVTRQAESIVAGQYDLGFTVVAYYAPKSQPGSSAKGQAQGNSGSGPTGQEAGKTQPDAGGGQPQAQTDTGGRI